MGMIALTGCSGPNLETKITSAPDANIVASNHIEWESSEQHPRKIFANLQMRMMSEPSEEVKAQLRSQVCSDLEMQSDMNLTLFENEINDKTNASMIEDCKPALLQRLEKHSAKEMAKLAAVTGASWSTLGSKNNFKFPDNTQARDVSRGYKAVNGDVAKKEIVLTFDDGPSGIYTPMILKALAEVNAKAVFFTMGKNVRSNREVLKQVAAAGHSIGTHSNTHACLGTSNACKRSNGRIYSFSEAASEIKLGHQAVYETIGWVDPFFRFPYGEGSPQLKEYLRKTGTGEFFWNIDSLDWKAQSNVDFYNFVMSEVGKNGRGILLFHDIQRKTAETLPAILKGLYQKGYSIVLLQPADLKSRYNSPLVTKGNLP